MSLPQHLRYLFNTAVLVDDQWGDLRTTATDDQPRANQLFQTLQTEGYIASPIVFHPQRRWTKEVERVVQAVKGAKLLILDWRLNYRPNARTKMNDERKRLLASLLGRGASPVSDDQSEPAKEIIRRLVEDPALGRKYVVIYTSDVDTDSASQTVLLKYLCKKWERHPKHSTLLEQAQKGLALGASKGKKNQPMERVPLVLGNCFITFISKNLEADEVLREFSERVNMMFGPFNTGFLTAASTVEQGAWQAILEIAKPMDVPISMHAIQNVNSHSAFGSFLTGLVRDYTLLEQSEQNESIADDIHKRKQQALQKAIEFADSKEFQAWIIAAKASGLIKSENVNWTALLTRLSECNSLEDMWTFYNSVSSALADLKSGKTINFESIQAFFKVPESDSRNWKVLEPAWQQAILGAEMLVAYDGWQYRNQSPSLSEFFDEVKRQNARFANLLTFNRAGRSFRTGAVYRRRTKDGNDNEYLVCITPFCDTARPEKVDHHHKFLIGKAHKPNKWKDKSGQSEREFFTFLPVKDGNETGIVLVEWRFYQTEVYDFSTLENDSRTPANKAAAADQIPAASRSKKKSEPGSPQEQKFHTNNEFVGQLKREYIQQLMNQYLAYHARAGVSELYYKELRNLLSFTHVHS